MSSTLVTVLLAVLAVVVIGLLLRRAGGGDVTPAAGRSPEEGVAPSRDDELGEQLDDFVDDDVEAVAVTSEGYSFLPDLHAVRILPPVEGDEEQPWAKPPEDGRGGRHRRGDAAITLSLHSGDLTGARVVRGGAGEGPWRLETLGRDGEYACWSFETRDAAVAAQTLLEARGVVALGTDDASQPVPPSREAWEEARRLWEETQAELAMDLDDEDERPR